MGRGKIEIKRIESTTNRQVTFSKRRGGLLKKAHELAVLTDTQIGLIIFSSSGKLYEYCSPSSSMGEIIDRYQKATNTHFEDLNSHQQLHCEISRIRHENDKLQASIRQFTGEDLTGLTINDLKQLEEQLEFSITKVRTRKNWEMEKGEAEAEAAAEEEEEEEVKEEENENEQEEVEAATEAATKEVVEEEEEEEEQNEQELSVLETMAEDEVREIEMILQYKFGTKRLLYEAFTHASYNYLSKKDGKCNYERLEFVGDAALGCLMAREMFSSYGDLSPGQLTLLRAANVNTERLARIAVESNLHRFLRHKAPQLEWQIQEFMDGMNQYPIHSNGLLDPPKALADIVESIIGAIFIDSNNSLETVWKVFKRVANPLINIDTLRKHPVTELYEICQKNRMHVSFIKDKWTESTTVDVFVDGRLFGSGSYSHKKEIAQNRAAKAPVDRLKMILQSS